MFFKKLLNRVKKRNASLPLAGRMGGGFLPRVIKNRPFFRNLSRTGMMRSPLMMRGNLDERIADRMRRGLGGMLNPNMQFALGDTPSMKARMLGLPDLASQPVGNNEPVPPQQPSFSRDRFGMPVIGRRSDIMPRNPGFGVNIPKRPPIMPGALGMKEGGEAKQYPNAGLAALAEERPDVVKKILGKEGGGIMDIQNFPRRSPEMLISQLNDMIDKDSMYAESNFLPSSIFESEEDLLRNSRKPLLTPAGMLIGQIRDLITGADIENDQVALEKVNFLRQRLMDNIQAIEDGGGTVDPSIKAQARMIERRFLERNMPLDQGVRRVGDSFNVPAFTD